MEGEGDTVSFQKNEGASEAPAQKTTETEAEIKPGESSVVEVPETTTAPAAGSDDVLEIPKAIPEDYGNCFVEVAGKGMYKPVPFKGAVPPPCMTKAEAAPKEEPAQESLSGWSSFVKGIKDSILNGQKGRSKERTSTTMKLFNELPREQAPFVPAEDVVPVTDFRCNCVIDSDVNGKKSPYVAQGWLTVTQTALIFNGTILLSPARPYSVPEPEELDVAFAIDVATIVSVVAAHCEDSDDIEVLSGTRAPLIVACDSVDNASAVILFDRSNHAHQFFDFSWGFTNYAPDAVRSIICQCNLPEAAPKAASDEAAPAQEAAPKEAAPEEAAHTEDKQKEQQEEVTTISMDDNAVMA